MQRLCPPYSSVLPVPHRKLQFQAGRVWAVMVGVCHRKFSFFSEFRSLQTHRDSEVLRPHPSRCPSSRQLPFVTWKRHDEGIMSWSRGVMCAQNSTPSAGSFFDSCTASLRSPRAIRQASRTTAPSKQVHTYHSRQVNRDSSRSHISTLNGGTSNICLNT